MYVFDTVMTNSGEEVNVVIVKANDAHIVKKKLLELNILDKDFRLAPAADSLLSSELIEQNETYIAVPLNDDGNNQTNQNEIDSILLKYNIPFRFGSQFCPYSSSFLGNHNRISRSCQLLDQGTRKKLSLTLVQSGVIKAFVLLMEHQGIATTEACQNIMVQIEEKVCELGINTCPKTLQYFGDDKTIVIPLKSFDIDRDDAFRSFILFGLSLISDTCEGNCCEMFLSTFFWKGLANAFSSSRVVRRGEISPESKIRLSEYKILWPRTEANTTIEDGPGSPGWITITENGIRQSFDLTKVMFSRGNITEKIRFGTLVKPGEIVLDMYAGIGYFTLPALIHGGAEHVYCCEWNEQACKFFNINLYYQNK